MSDKSISVTHILNPFVPSKRATEFVDWHENLSVKECVGDYAREVVVSINGGIVEAGDLSSRLVADGDSVVICPVPQGGGDNSKQIFRMIAMMAVVSFAGWAAGPGGLGLSGNGALFAKFGILAVGAALIDSLLPIEPGKTEDVSDSSSYGIDGAKNVSTEGISVPICYGQFRMAGNIIGMYVENSGDTQYLYMLMNAGEGPIAGISDFKINDQPSSNYQDVKTAIRLGHQSQPAISWFDDIVTPKNKSVKLSDSWAYHTTDGDINKIRVDVVFPSGLYKLIRDTGKTQVYSVSLEIEFRAAGTSDAFKPLPHDKLSSATYSTVYDYHYNEGYTIDGTEYIDESLIRNGANEIVGYVTVRLLHNGLSSTFTIQENKKSAYRLSFITIDLPSGSHEIRYRRTTPEFDNDASDTDDIISDSVTVTDINEIKTADIRYVNTALAAVRVKLTDQLSSIPNVTYINKGRIVRTINDDGSTSYKASNNPAWIALDILTNTRYGAGMSDDFIDIEMIKEWAAHCETSSLTFNGVLDVASNLWDSLKHVLVAGHAQIVVTGTRYTVAIERADTPVMMFGMGNIIKDSFSISWLPMEERANEVEVSFHDKLDDYKQRSIKVYDQESFDSGRSQNSASVTLFGIVDAQRAYDEGVMLLNMNRYIHQTVSFEAPLESIACTVGDLIYVQHDMPKWGTAGRIPTDGTSSVNHIDVDVEIPPLADGTTYKCVIHTGALLRYTGTVTNISGNNVTLSGFDGVNEVKRLKVAGLDLNVEGVFSSGPDFGVTVSDVTGIAVTNSYELFDTDAIEEVNVASVDTRATTGTHYRINFETPLSFVPSPLSNFMFGADGKVKKPFRVISIDSSHDYSRKITAIEYNESVYDANLGVVATPNYSSLLLGAEHVTITDVVEKLVYVGSMIRSAVTVNWIAPNDKLYGGADVYVGLDGAIPTFAGNVNGHTKSFTIEADDGVQVEFKVVAYDMVGSKASFETAPVKQHVVLGKTAPPSDVQNFTFKKVVGGIVLSWDAVEDIDLDGYEIRKGNSWDVGEVITKRLSGLSLFVPIDAAGTYSYVIRAMDTSGNYSAQVATVNASILTPGNVLYLDVTQNNSQITFRWPTVSYDGTLRYEIREGESWANSSLVAIVNSDTYTMTADDVGDKKYLIKAVDIVGISSLVAAYVTTSIVQLSNYNALFSSDQRALSFVGFKYKMTVQPGGELRLDNDETYGDYSFEVDLGQTYRARNTLSQAIRSVVDIGTTWATATFAWNSASANRPWLEEGNPHNTEYITFISRKLNLDPKYIEAFSFNGTTTGENGATPTASVSVSYAQGRYFNGVYNTEGTTVLDYDVSIPSEFSYSLWVNADDGATDFEILKLGDVGFVNSLTLRYNSTLNQIELVGSDSNTVVAPIVVETGERMLLAISQSATTRNLGVATADGQYVWMSGSFAPISAWSKVSL